jgi:hypothetical protein
VVIADFKCNRCFNLCLLFVSLRVSLFCFCFFFAKVNHKKLLFFYFWHELFNKNASPEKTIMLSIIIFSTANVKIFQSFFLRIFYKNTLYKIMFVFSSLKYMKNFKYIIINVYCSTTFLCYVVFFLQFLF